MKKIIILTIASIFIVGGFVRSESPSFLGIEFVKIPTGEFQMGSNNGDDNEKPVHTVYLDTYYISKYEVTFSQFDAFCKATGWRKPYDRGWGRTGSRPAFDLRWKDAVAFCKWYSRETGKNVHLPTEAQWEKACRAGSSGERYGHIDAIAWHRGNSEKVPYKIPYPVGQKQPNGYGLYDMLGNVWEWCSDCYDPKYYSISPSRNPSGPSLCYSSHVLRGGGVASFAGRSRSAMRGRLNPYFYAGFTGFRLAMD